MTSNRILRHALGSGASVFDHLNQASTRLEDVTARIFQGIKTSADKVYIVEEISRSNGIVRIFSSQTGQEHDLEPDLLHPLIKGGDSKAFLLTTTNRLILFPYAPHSKGTTTLLHPATFRRQYRLTWAYLEQNREYLENRENGRMKHDRWYGYIYPKALEVMQLPKLFTPDLAPTSAFSYDSTGEVFFTGGAAGGYGIIPQPKIRAEFLLGLLNSCTVDFFHHNVATQMRGGWYSYESRFIHNLPIAAATQRQEALVVHLVEYLLWLKRCFQAHTAEKTARDGLMLGYWEQLLNGLVYELYFPEELHARAVHLFDLVQQASLPAPDSIPEAQRLSRLHKEFERVYDLQHPLRAALHDLQTVEEVRIIEGKA